MSQKVPPAASMNPQHLQHLVVQWLLRVAMNPQHLLMHVTPELKQEVP